MLLIRQSPRHNLGSVPWMLLLKVGIVALVTVFIVRAVREARADFQTSGFSIKNIHLGWLVVAGMAYAMGLLPMALNWHRLLSAMGQSLPCSATVRTHYVSQLGKYVPGKAMVMLIRLGLLKPFRVDTATAVLSMFAETLANMSIGAVLAGVIVAFQFRDRPEIALLAASLAVVAGLPITPPILRHALRWLRKRRFASTDNQGTDEQLTWSVLAPGWLGILVGWCLLGFTDRRARRHRPRSRGA